MPQAKKTSRSTTGKVPHHEWRALHLTPNNDWQQYVLLNRPQIDKVFERFALTDFPYQIPLHMVDRFIRNFDTEGYVVDSNLTAGCGWNDLPGDQYDLLFRPRKPSDDVDCGTNNSATADASASASRRSSPISTLTELTTDAGRDNDAAVQQLVDMARQADQVASSGDGVYGNSDRELGVMTPPESPSTKRASFVEHGKKSLD
ncbi:hypothetical protein IWX49DRAFT_618446 [Phyllosticta citricarpa]|uniref:Uncharacterized protein n=2 Tax=Phyllosticta TaxID=121621 RepID=A0ABR1LRU5_9PEZI